MIARAHLLAIDSRIGRLTALRAEVQRMTESMQVEAVVQGFVAQPPPFSDAPGDRWIAASELPQAPERALISTR